MPFGYSQAVWDALPRAQRAAVVLNTGTTLNPGATGAGGQTVAPEDRARVAAELVVEAERLSREAGGASDDELARRAMVANAQLPSIGHIQNFTPDAEWVRNAEEARRFAYALGQGESFDADLVSGRDPYGLVQWMANYSQSSEGKQALVQRAQQQAQAEAAQIVETGRRAAEVKASEDASSAEQETARQAETTRQEQAQRQQSAMGLATPDGRMFGSLPENERATWIAQHGGDVVAAATAWQAEAMNRGRTQASGQTGGDQAGQASNAVAVGGRTVTPGLQRWAAQHGGSYNGWDALSDAERAKWEAGNTTTGDGKAGGANAGGNLGGRPDTPGLRRWMAEHGGSINGWDALSDAQRAAYERGGSFIAGTAAPGTTNGQRFQTPWGEADADTPPGNMGLDWWTQWALMMDRLTDDSGVIRDPVSGKPLTNADGSLQRTLDALDQEARIRQKDEEIRQSQLKIDDLRRAGDLDRAQQESEYARTLQLDRDREAEKARQYNETLGYDIGIAIGELNGRKTLDAQRFEEDRAAALYNRAANPAMSFENEFSRGSGGSYYDTASGQVQVGQAPASQVAAVARGMTGPDIGSGMTSAAAPQVRTPAFLNVLRSGGYTPTVGAVNAASTTTSADQAALGEDFFRLQNRKAEPRLTSVQKMIRGSYGRAGGVSDEQQSDLLSAGMPKETALRPSFSGR